MVIFFFTIFCLFEHAPRLAYANSPAPELKTPQVYYIQDAHNSLEAQEDISRIIHQLVKEKGVKTVYVEGYEGDDLSGVLDKLYPFPDKSVKEIVSHFFLDYLRLSGAQYSFINRNEDFKLIGIENLKDYLANLKAYENSAKNRETIQKDLDEISKYLKALADRLYPREIQAFQKLKERFGAEKLSLADYIFRLFKLGASGNYPHLSLVTTYLGKSELSKSEQEELNEKLKAIDSEIFFGELNRLEKDLIQQFLKDPIAEKTFHYQRTIELLEKLNNLTLMPEEYSELLAANGELLKTAEIAQFLATNLKKPLILKKDWEDPIQENLRFYALAKKRDANFKSHLQTLNTGLPVIVVTGGFHKDSLTQFFEEQKISYAVISPRITKEDPIHEERYEFLMTGKSYAFEKRFVSTGKFQAAAVPPETSCSRN